MNELTHLDLCSGIGGFALAFEREGFRTVGFAEIEPYCCRILAKHWPKVRNYGDLRTVPAVQCCVITAGFPCQPFSVAGQRRGAADNRYLWPAVRDVIDRCRPAWFLGENVTGIIGLELDRVLVDLEGIGYAVQPFVIPACARELPTVERHVWIVATPRRPILEGSPAQRLSRKASIAIRWSDCPGDAFRRDFAHLPEPILLASRKGIPDYVAEIEAIGNAIPPPIAQIFACAIRQTIEAYP